MIIQQTRLSGRSIARKSGLMILVLAVAFPVFGAVLLEEQFTTLDPAKWTVTNINNSTATAVGGELVLDFNNGPWAPGASVTGVSSINLGGKAVVLTFKKIDYVNALYDLSSYRSYKIGLTSTAWLSYGHNGSHEYVRLTVGGNEVFYSQIWPQETLIPDGQYYGFRLYPNKWEIIRSVDGISYETVFAGSTSVDLNIQDTAFMCVENANDYGSKLILDNLKIESIEQIVWCHYTAWYDWHNASKALVSGCPDGPLAHPTGEIIPDYRQEINAAIKSGIDVFAVDLPQDHLYSEHLGRLLAAASETNFRIAGCLDSDNTNVTAVADTIVQYLVPLFSHPNFMRVDGRPVLLTFWAWRRPPEFWLQLRNVLNSRGHQIYLIGDPDTVPGVPATPTEHARWIGCFDQLYTFQETGRGDTQTISDSFQIIKTASATTSLRKQWTAGIVPGYSGGWGTWRNDFYVPFRGFDQLWNSWEAAVALNPDGMHLTTWNDQEETPLQPMMFQFHSYCELNRYWVDRWRGKDMPSSAPRVYLAYQREQILGTLQRIEVISLPTSAGDNVVVSLKLRDTNGNEVVSLPAQTMPANQAVRREWLVPTTQFAATPVVEPEVTVSCGGVETIRRLPVFINRTGWIANQVVVKAPVHEMGNGQAALSMTQINANTIEAAVNIDSSTAVKYVTLWRNDKPVGSFATGSSQNTVFSLSLGALRDHNLSITLEPASMPSSIGAYQTMLSAGGSSLQWNAQSVRANIGPYNYCGVNLLGNLQETAMLVSVNNQSAGRVALADLMAGPISLPVSNPAIKFALSPVDTISANPRSLNVTQSTLTRRFHIDKAIVTDLFYVRCETHDGRTFFSNCLTPFSQGKPPVKTTVLQTSVSLDNPTYFTSPVPFTTPSPIEVNVHPAMIQQSYWLSKNSDVQDQLGRINLNPMGVVSSIKSDGFYCFEFDGVDDSVQLPIRQVPHGSFTLSFDIYPIGPYTRTQTIFGRNGWLSCPLVQILSNGKVYAGRNTTGTATRIMATSSTALPAATWSRVRITFDETKVSIFINAKLSAQATGTAARVYGNNQQYMGGPTNFFKGKISNFYMGSSPNLHSPAAALSTSSDPLVHLSFDEIDLGANSGTSGVNGTVKGNVSAVTGVSGSGAKAV